jgi:hypothetical protein
MNKDRKSKNEEVKNAGKDETKQAGKSKLSRRDFLGRAGTAGAIGAGLLAFPSLLGNSGSGLAQKLSPPTILLCEGGCEFVPKGGIARADMAYTIRIEAAKYERDMPIPAHPCNGDEELYNTRNFFASFTKGLKRSSVSAQAKRGEVDPVEYCKLLKALATGIPANFEAVLLGFSNDCDDVAFSNTEASLAANAFLPNKQRRLESPQAGLNYDLEGKDYHQLISRLPNLHLPPIAFPVAFKFDSREEATEIVENYWQALTRDVPFIQYLFNTDVENAATDLNTHFKPYYHGPLDGNGNISARVYSRGILPGDEKGPYLSQFFLHDIPYGAQTISARINSPAVTKDNNFMTDANEWRMIQTGQTPNRQTIIDGKRYIRSGRDLAEYVHNDAIFQAYFNAALILVKPPKLGGLGVPVNPNNPYNAAAGGYCKQNNFVEFGVSQLLTLLGEVSVRAHKAVWYQKWNVHRRLRPEEFSGRIHFNQFSPVDPPNYPVNNIIYNSSALPITQGIYGSLFLPQAFPEGSPMHPAYGAGHATLAGACVTILKAWFDSERRFTDFSDLFQPAADGDSLVPYFAADIGNITVANELNKLASNISIGRNIAGVHWRSDYTESVFLGEQVAIQLLEDYGYTYNEDFDGFIFRNFNGQLITVGAKKTV